MGLFNRLGREVEQFKQSAMGAAAADEFRCVDCGAEFATAYEACPECDADAVVPLDRGAGSGDGAAEGGEADAGESADPTAE